MKQNQSLFLNNPAFWILLLTSGLGVGCGSQNYQMDEDQPENSNNCSLVGCIRQSQPPQNPSVTPQPPQNPSVTPQPPQNPSVTPQPPQNPSVTPQPPQNPTNDVQSVTGKVKVRGQAPSTDRPPEDANARQTLENQRTLEKTNNEKTVSFKTQKTLTLELNTLGTAKNEPYYHPALNSGWTLSSSCMAFDVTLKILGSDQESFITKTLFINIINSKTCPENQPSSFDFSDLIKDLPANTEYYFLISNALTDNTAGPGRSPSMGRSWRQLSQDYVVDVNYTITLDQ